MKKRPTLLRNFSDDSEQAEKMLLESQVEYVRVFVREKDERLPQLIHSSGSYTGVSGVRSFIRSCIPPDVQSKAGASGRKTP